MLLGTLPSSMVGAVCQSTSLKNDHTAEKVTAVGTLECAKCGRLGVREIGVRAGIKNICGWWCVEHCQVWFNPEVVYGVVNAGWAVDCDWWRLRENGMRWDRGGARGGSATEVDTGDNEGLCRGDR
ncbi:hypothetical protein SARC_01298 [Sphaeroforma arctica JP610]|uniref:Uncharacterized protein n=1 Tax=Sphaeroforma arctica JP610 TaxID=667725 RepID=A0A0L0GC66_9EUKA|nr:hypothetical protein SARC_01298 [Sphaeroforma arctica JP610]KNC86575.1 hypothetical protein SARC_01298 [Sphaeroforma arctica JP610]|eukprot:XP_014160477.1 hypothetical protein SARC_01298 [Sphaeroforma arctica JP610]